MPGIITIFTSVRKVDRTFNTFVHYELRKQFYHPKIRKEGGEAPYKLYSDRLWQQRRDKNFKK